ncbi:MAG: hypothetical protein OEW12_02215 [Deltaproteobacteria bacterium]|nr:hypothetical protein [Deltaproteobacteria bacterium]
MILSTLKSQFVSAESTTLEFVDLMRVTFSYYSDLRGRFFSLLPANTRQGELTNLLTGDLRSRLLNKPFCDRIQESLKAVRRSVIRLEDLRAQHPAVPALVNNLQALAKIAESVENLYQKHWECYRYQAQLSEKETVEFLMEIDRIGYDWDIYLESFTQTRTLVAALQGRGPGQGEAVVQVGYQRDNPFHDSAGGLIIILQFLEGCYRFICALYRIDPAQRPLSVLQVEIDQPVHMMVGVPEQCGKTYQKFLQHLFLKDMLQRDALLKFVMESVKKETGNDLSPATLLKHQKELNALIKTLPEGGQFTISDRVFPDDSVVVMREFMVTLDQQNISYESLLKASEKIKKTTAMRAAKPSIPPAAGTHPFPTKPSIPLMAKDGFRQITASDIPSPPEADKTLLQNKAAREHIRILTEREG